MITARVTPESELIEKVVYINRVAKVVKGGRRFSFGAIVVVGDGKGNVGMAHGKANEVPEAISKGTERAKRLMTKVTVVDGTLPHEVIGRYGASTVYAPPGKVRASSPAALSAPCSKLVASKTFCRNRSVRRIRTTSFVQRWTV